ncbi:MAG TPA: terminase small subunit [Accumulibacter sp.]|nr:terminase small subunit [Accumulibacter sp.]
MALTDKQAKFVDEYLVDLNATQACIRAGYSAKTADRIGPELLGKTCVAEAVKAAMEKRSKRVQRTADDVMRDLAAIRADAMQIVHDKDGNAVMLDKPSAIKTLELEGKHLAMWTDKQQLSGDVGLTVKVTRFSDA